MEKLRTDRRVLPAAARLAQGILRLYERATQARGQDAFVRDAQSWIDLEQAALPEMNSFEFVGKRDHRMHTPSSVLADAMGELWVADRAALTLEQCVGEIVARIGDQFEIAPRDRRRGSRDSLGIDVTG